MQIEEIVCKAEKSDIDVYVYHRYMLPYTEIPRWLNSKHQSVGNSKVVEFRVGRKFPNAIAFYFALGESSFQSADQILLVAYLSINGFKKGLLTAYGLDFADTLQISSLSRRQYLLQLPKPLDEFNISDDNHVEVTYEIRRNGVEAALNNPPCEIRWWGVKVECICCPQISSILSSRMALTLDDNDSDSDLNLPLEKRRKY